MAERRQGFGTGRSLERAIVAPPASGAGADRRSSRRSGSAASRSCQPLHVMQLTTNSAARFDGADRAALTSTKPLAMASPGPCRRAAGRPSARRIVEQPSSASGLMWVLVAHDDTRPVASSRASTRCAPLEEISWHNGMLASACSASTKRATGGRSGAMPRDPVLVTGCSPSGRTRRRLHRQRHDHAASSRVIRQVTT